MIELHDKYLAYVNYCFMKHTLFHKVCIVASLINHQCDGIVVLLFLLFSLLNDRSSRLLKKLLKYSATKVLLEVQVQSYLPHFVIIFLRVEVRN